MPRYVWTEKERQTAYDMRDKGASFKQISRELGNKTDRAVSIIINQWEEAGRPGYIRNKQPVYKKSREVGITTIVKIDFRDGAPVSLPYFSGMSGQVVNIDKEATSDE